MCDLKENFVKKEYMCLYCPEISERELIYLNIANFLTTLNSYFVINGERKTLLEHFKFNNLGIDDRTIENIVAENKSAKCCSRLVCEDLITWMYKHEGWPYNRVDLKFIPFKKIKVTKKYISKNLGGIKKMMFFFSRE